MNNSNKHCVAAILLTLAVTAFGQDVAAQRKLTAAEKAALPQNDSLARGPVSAKVTIVAFMDYQCPHSLKTLPTIAQLENEFSGNVRVVYRHLPLPFHSDAALAAEAAFAADDQGRFWEFHNLMFAHQDALGLASLLTYAKQLSLDLPKFKAALEARKFKARVAVDLAAAKALGAAGTPTVFINGEKFEGAQPFAVLKTAVEKHLRPEQEAKCLKDGAFVSGVLTQEKFAHPNPEIGQLSAFILTLDSEVCVNVDGATLKGRRVQLFPKNEPALLKLIGRRATAIGAFGEPGTAYHRGEILLFDAAASSSQ